MYLFPDLVLGRGPTISIAMRWNGVLIIGIGIILALTLRPELLWHTSQVLQYRAISWPVIAVKDPALGLLHTHVTCCWHVMPNTKYGRAALGRQNKLLLNLNVPSTFSLWHPPAIQETPLKEKGCCVSFLRVTGSFSQFLQWWITLLPIFQLFREISKRGVWNSASPM